MTLDQIDRMVRQANPVPDLTALEPVDASVPVLQQRRTEMQTHDRVKVEDAADKPRRGLLIGFAAAAVVAIGALILIQQRQSAPVADEPTTTSAVEIATAFVEAYAAFDTDKAGSYVAADADLSRFAGGSDWRLQNRLLEAHGFKLLLDSCDLLTGPSTTSVRCAFDYHGIRSDEIGLGPFSGSWFDISLQGEEVISALLHWGTEEFAPQVWEPFADWVAQTYPNDVSVMYTGASQSDSRLTEESIALWEQRSREYVEVVKGTSG